MSVLNATLFEEMKTILSSLSVIKINLPSTLKEDWERIFEEEYIKATHKIVFSKEMTDKSILSKNALANFRRQMANVSITGNFHLDQKELFIDGSKNVFTDKGTIIFQRELMILEECPLANIEEEILKGIYTMMMTAIFCTVIGG